MELRENDRKMKENQQITYAAATTVFLCFQLQDDPKYNLYMDGYVTSQAFQRDFIHSIWTSNDQIMTLGSCRKKRRDHKSDQLDIS